MSRIVGTPSLVEVIEGVEAVSIRDVWIRVADGVLHYGSFSWFNTPARGQTDALSVVVVGAPHIAALCMLPGYAAPKAFVP